MLMGLIVLIALLVVLSIFIPSPKPIWSQPADYQNISYSIDGMSVQLKNGTAVAPAAPGSASMVSTQYFGNIAKGDLDSDGIPDLAFLLTQSGGGSGTFYYVVAAIQHANNSYTGTDAILLGDRIAPQTTEIRDGEIVVNYADRKPNEPMTTQPSVGVTKYLKVSNGKLVETDANGSPL